jgi:hypothetical protein
MIKPCGLVFVAYPYALAMISRILNWGGSEPVSLGPIIKMHHDGGDLALSVPGGLRAALAS